MNNMQVFYEGDEQLATAFKNHIEGNFVPFPRRWFCLALSQWALLLQTQTPGQDVRTLPLLSLFEQTEFIDHMCACSSDAAACSSAPSVSMCTH